MIEERILMLKAVDKTLLQGVHAVGNRVDDMNWPLRGMRMMRGLAVKYE